MAKDTKKQPEVKQPQSKNKVKSSCGCGCITPMKIK